MKITESSERQVRTTRGALTRKLAQKAVKEAVTIKVYNVTEVSGDSIIEIVGQALDRASGNMEKHTYLAMPTLGVMIGIYREGEQNIDVVITKWTKGEE